VVRGVSGSSLAWAGGPAPAAGPGDWLPSASLEALRARAGILRRIRGFFDARGVWEVETPLLAAATATDPALASLETRCTAPGAPAVLYLQTSPEHAMKRLLAAGSGSIYQITRAFRDGEAGRLHNPEFTLLEWYRVGFDEHALMEEVEALVREALAGFRAFPPRPFRRVGYREAFRETLGLDPARADARALARAARAEGLEPAGDLVRDRAALEAWLLGCVVVPRLSGAGPVFVHAWPAEQAALARVRPGAPPTAARFELFVDGLELANGYHELADPHEQRLRIERDRRHRRAAGLPVPPVDGRLLAALEAGLPDCAGVALGVDRLVMVALGLGDIRAAMAFPLERA